ncbi:ladinin-1 [Eublepharis macularius]|uniref:Ladinin-1 n=1 Tax=Eublepharis macularius TaxID=481883 RepID=A0AA97JFT2_EUBMA|nr:ladinin-1 [Eublepharis macularius]
MSFNRKNWSALSSLAQQWSVEDEEEQERERRRRHRQLSSSSDAKQETSSTEQKVTCRVPNRFHNSSEEKPLNSGNSILEIDRKLVETLNKPNSRRTKWKAENLNNVKQDKKDTVNVRKLEVDEEKAESVVEPVQEQKEPKLEEYPDMGQQKNPTEDKPQNLRLIKREPVVKKHENLEQDNKNPQLSKDQQSNEKQKVLNAHESQGAPETQNEMTTQKSQRAAWERRSISRLEVKINSRVRNSTEASSPPPPSGPQATERSIPKIDEADGQDGSEVSSSVSHPLVTYSSSFRRVSPRTISFRVVSPKDKQDTLSRSASMRLPASTAKFGEKLEKYTSAVQRAGSIKLSPSARKNFQPSSEGVASKRNIFEANAAVRAEPVTTVRKESLTIPGGVTSRINLWISRSQEPSKDEGLKDTRRPENMAQQSQWREGPSES